MTIAVIDSAFCDHPDIASSDSRKVWLVDGTEENWQATDFYACGATAAAVHGLAVANAAGGNGRFPGAAPEANLLLVKGGSGRRGRSINGNREFTALLEWVLERREEYNICVLVCSIGFGVEDRMSPWQRCPISRAVERAADAGILMVGIATNTSWILPPPPMNAPSALCVGGMEHGWAPDDPFQLYHHGWGATVEGRRLPDLVAPCDFPIPLPPRKAFSEQKPSDPPGSGYDPRLGAGYGFGSGTSSAAPFVAGVAGLCLSAAPRLDPRTLRQALLQSCRTVDGIPLERQGRGLINPAMAAELAQKATAVHAPCAAPADWLTVKEWLGSGDALKRQSAISAAWTGTLDPEQIESLIPFVNSTHAEVVCTAVLLGATLPNFRDRPEIRAMQNHPSPHVRCAWADVTCLGIDPSSIESCRLLLRDGNQDLRQMGAAFSRRANSAELLPDLIRIMGEGNGWPQFSTARAAVEKISGKKFAAAGNGDPWSLETMQADIAQQWRAWYASTAKK